MAGSPTVLITGASDGLGRQLAVALAGRGASLILHGRNRERLEAALEDVRSAGGRDARMLLADLSDLSLVAGLADQVTESTPRLGVLVNNAAIGPGHPGSPRELSADGHELRFAVNYLAPFLLTHRLLPLLRRSAPARILNLASVGQEDIDFTDVMLSRGYDGWRAYRQTKLALIMLTFDLAEELAGSGVTVNALHPATLMPTRMVAESGVGTLSRVNEGVAATLPQVADPSFDGISGRYYNQGAEARARPQAYDRESRRRLRELATRLTAEHLGVGLS